MAEACDEVSVQKIQARLRLMDKLFHLYSWLMNSYTTDYFSLSLEKNFPPSFISALLESCSLRDLALFLPDWENNNPGSNTGKGQSHSNSVLPLSMLSLRALCHHLSLNQSKTCKTQHGVFGTDMEKYFRVCVKAKKRHEIDNLSQVISSICKQTGCNHVVDLGAGLGHLSRILTYNKFLKVTTIEATDSHSPKAQRLDQQTSSLLSHKKVSDGSQTTKPSHISHWINSTITTDEFIELLNQNDSSLAQPSTVSAMVGEISAKMNDILSEARNSQSDADSGGMCLSGLHACGDLSATLLRVFVRLDCAEVLSSVGCCYMKLSHDRDSSAQKVKGFPMSSFVASLPHYQEMCSYEALEMGCHFATQYRKRLLDEEASLRRHVVRAALQTLLYRRRSKSQLQFKRLKIKNSESLPFEEYVEKAFSRMGLPFDVTKAEILECETIIETHWRAVVGAYSVRLALAPLVEAYILLDRMLYLYEQGIHSRLTPVFDPSVSPRNMVLIASKKCQVIP